ncbi:lytic transglycosylase domain-containing protein [Prevotella falsenii]
MIRKRNIFAIALLLMGVSATYAQHQVVKDNRGRTMQVYIPKAEEKADGLEVEYTDTKFYGQEKELNSAASPIEMEDEAAAISRLIKRVTSSLSLTYNPEVQKYIDRYVKQGRRSTSCLLARASYYNPIFEEALLHYGLPMELKHLPVIESGLNPKAISGKGAAGLWQFMPTTGREYDLQINTFVDERLDPIKSSYAAARMLADLYNRFGDWSLALAAYNCGSGRVSNAIEKAGEAADFWQIYEFLPKETRGYVPAFIAANYVMNYYAEYNILPEPTGLPEKAGKVVVTEDISLAKIADVLNMDIADLRMLNPQYRQGIVKTTDGTATLLLPSEKVKCFTDNVSRLYENNENTENQRLEMAASVVKRTMHNPHS